MIGRFLIVLDSLPFSRNEPFFEHQEINVVDANDAELAYPKNGIS
jgi:hypothetical protein